MSPSVRVSVLLGIVVLLAVRPPARAAHPAPPAGPELVLQNGHARSVRAVAFSPNGRTVVSGSDDETARLWDLARGRVVATLAARGQVRDGLRCDASVDAVAFSPDGRIVATGSHDGALHLWETATGRALAALTGPTESVTSVAFSPDGRILAAASTDKSIRLWDVARRNVRTLIPGETSVYGVAFSPDGKLLAAAGEDGALALFSAAGARRASLPVSNVGVTAVAFSPDGRTLAAVTSAAEVAAFDVASHRRRFVGRVVDMSSATGLAFAPDGKRLAVAAAAAAYVVDAGSGRVQAALSTHDHAIYGVAWSPDGRLVAGAASDARVYLWNPADGREHPPLAGHAACQLDLAASPDGSLLAGAARDGSASLWDLATGRLRAHHSWPASCMAVAVHPDDRTVAVALRDGSVHLWDADGDGDRLLAEPPSRRDEGVNGLAFSPDGRTLAVAGDDREVRLYDVASGRVRAALRGHEAAVAAVAWSPDGRQVASGAYDGIVIVWDAATRAQLQQRRMETRSAYRRCYNVAYSPDGKRLAGGGDDGTVQVWDLDFEDGPRVAAGPVRRAVQSVRFSPDGRTLAATLDNDILLFDAASEQLVGTLSGHTEAPTALAFLPASGVLASVGLDATFRLWDARGPAAPPLATAVSLDAGRNWVVTAPDGRFDGSAGGQDLMEWRLGDGRYALGQFFNEFYTPGLLARVVHPSARSGARPRALPALAGLKPPPRVSIISPAGGSHLAAHGTAVQVKVEDQGGGISRPALYRNGHRLAQRLCQASGAGAWTWAVTLEHGVNDLRATACNAAGDVESRADEVRLYCDAPVPHPPTLYVLAVGIDHYRSGLSLGFAADDARAIGRFFKPGLFARVAPVVLLNEHADKRSIVAALQAIGREAAPQDTAVVYLAGHGALEGELFYFLPYDARPQTDASLCRSSLSQVELGDALSGIAAARQIVILDACHAGASATALGRLVASRDAVATIRAQQRLARSSGTFLVAAATAQQYAKEFPELGHGVLTYAILRALGAGGQPAAAVNRDGQVTVDALLHYLSDAVPTLTERYHGGRQDVVQYSTGQDFPLVLARP